MAQEAYEVGDRVVFDDPDAGEHAGECEWIERTLVVGYVTEISGNELTINGHLGCETGDLTDDAPEFILNTFENENLTELTMDYHQGTHWHHREFWSECKHGNEEVWMEVSRSY